MLSVTQYRVDDDFFICRVAHNSRNNWLKPPLFRCLLFPMVHKPIKLFAGGTVDDLKLALVTLAAAAAMEAAQSILTVGILRAHLTPTADIFSSKSPFHGIFWDIKQLLY